MRRDRVLALTRYESLGASSRVRMLQYVPHLREHGVEVDVAPLLSNRYLRDLYQGRRMNVVDVATGYFRRLVKLLEAKRYPVVWVEKECLPWMPHAFERLMRRKGPRLIVDYDDAAWLRYAELENPVARRLLRDKIRAVMTAADVVTVGNRWLQAHARAWGAQRTVVLPSVVDLERYRARAPNPGHDVFRVGWIGTPFTAHYLQRVARPLARIAEARPLRLVCVGVDRVQVHGVEVEHRAWSQCTEPKEIGRFDIGVMPLEDTPWARGKCGYKLIQYMACGVPAVGSAVGANCEIIEDGKDGFLVANEDHWVSALETLRQDRALRAAFAAAGREKVARLYSLEAHVEQMAALLRP